MKWFYLLLSLKEFWIGLLWFTAIMLLGFAIGMRFPTFRWVGFTLPPLVGGPVSGAILGRVAGKR